MRNEKQKTVYSVPEFNGANIPVVEAARIMKKDQQFIREGMKNGILPIGLAYKKPGSQNYDYYISPKLFWEFTGYVYDGGVEEA
ncbi:MAG: hypothetical protein ACI4HI_11010 [Lachnospiraceae bacterium]